MCIACEMAWMIALDDLPDEPPPGFPRPRPDETPLPAMRRRSAKPAPPTPEDERKP